MAYNKLKILLTLALSITLSACGGGGGDADNNTGNGGGSSTDSKPVITLSGSSTVNLEVGDVYFEDGWAATDSEDGVLNESVTVTGSVGNTAGTYILTYSVEDSAGNTASVSRSVIVSAPQGSEPTLTTLTVFNEGLVDPSWDRDINAYDSAIGWGECNNDGGAGCPSIGWEIVSDSERGNVLQISHSAEGNAAGMFIGSTAQNLSEFTGGDIKFDIRVVSGDSNITMKIDCVWPCTSGDKALGSVGASGWETVTMPVDNLVAGGLDLAAVDTGLVIWASNATSTVFQLDNIRWEVTGGAGDTDSDGSSGGGDPTIKAINSTNWHHQTLLPNGWGWYNNEQQHYTDRIENSYVSNGSLKIVAIKESFRDQGQTKQYTSARLNSKYAFKYGRVAVRAKLPRGAGTWPAIWTLGKNISEPGAYWEINGFGTTGWPYCGEIDIMEHWGNNQNYVQSAMHTPSSHGGTINHGGQYISTVSSKFHVYEMDWNSERIIFSVDGKEHYTYAPTVKNSSNWPYDAEQYLLLNVAIQDSISSSFTQSAMEIDYVRVYADGAGPSDQPVWADEFE